MDTIIICVTNSVNNPNYVTLYSVVCYVIKYHFTFFLYLQLQFWFRILTVFFEV